MRHNTGGVLARVRQGETIDVTDHGKLIARITPAGEREPAPALHRLIQSGRVRLAVRPGFRPPMRDASSRDRLADELAAQRDDERW